TTNPTYCFYSNLLFSLTHLHKWVFCCLKFKLFKIIMLETLFFNDGDKMAAASKRERHLS
ncbi:hypothetical protein, partial [Escherichia coli]|uniref:hypothetical protein n=1 Tax=Escherichia coli TaxID=562 RepID=UPI001F10FFE6